MEKEKNSVLVVEDDAVMRKLLLRHLTEYVVYEAKDGIEGWDMYLQHNPDVVLTDLRMPQRDGLKLFKMIREHAPAKPVIILSGAGKMADVIETLRLGASDYLEKPLENQEIVLHTIRKALNLLRLEELDRNYQQNLESEIHKKTKILQDELEARRSAENHLRNAHKEWQRTFDAIPDLIAIIDENYRVIRANKAMKKVLQAEFEEDLHCLCYGKIHRTDNPPAFCPHKQLLQDGKAHTVEIYEEAIGGHYQVTVAPYYHEDGKTLQGSVHIARDINEQKELEKERESIQVQLLHSQKLESVGQLAAGIAHEINTPVQFVSSNNDFLEESFGMVKELIDKYDKLCSAAKDGKVDDTIFEEVSAAIEDSDWDYLVDEIPTAIRQNRDGLRRVASIVRAMKEFSHPGNREKELKNLNEIIETTTIVARNEWKYVSNLELDLDPDLPHVMCFSDDIGQVVLNMIINAAHAIEDKLGKNPEGEKGTISISSLSSGGFAEIQIKDTGSGMSEQIQKKVFDPFYTTKNVGRGTGQGLAIAWNVIKDKHHGEIIVNSVVEEGTTFTIRIPFAE